MSYYIEILGDGKIFVGVDMKAVAHSMKNEDFLKPETLHEYMNIVAERIQLLCGKHIRTNAKVAGFLEDLEREGFIKIHKGDEIDG